MSSSYASSAIWYEVERPKDERPREWTSRPEVAQDWLQHNGPLSVSGKIVPYRLDRTLAQRRDVDHLVASAVAAAAVEGVAVSAVTVQHARRLVANLPAWLQEPEVAVYPDGDIALEWQFGRSRMFTVLVDEQGKLHYAGLFGDSDVHGTEPSANELPPSILVGIQRALERKESDFGYGLNK